MYLLVLGHIMRVKRPRLELHVPDGGTPPAEKRTASGRGYALERVSFVGTQDLEFA